MQILMQCIYLLLLLYSLTVTRHETFVISDTQLIGLSFNPSLPLLCVLDENNIITIFNYLTYILLLLLL